MAVLLGWSDIARAASGVFEFSEVQPIAGKPELLIPAKLGSLNSSYYPAHPSRTSVFLIQDAHDSQEAQDKIFKILEHLKNKNLLDGVLVEGASGKLRSSWMDFFDDQKKNSEFHEMLSQKGLLSGVEKFLIRNPGMPAYGIENVQDYRRDLESLRRVFSLRRESLKFLRELKPLLYQKMETEFSGEALQFLKKWRSLQEHSEDWHHYVFFLMDWAQVQLAREWTEEGYQVYWPNLTRMAHLRRLEATVSREAALKEWEILKNSFGNPKPAIFRLLDPWVQAQERLTELGGSTSQPRLFVEELVGLMEQENKEMLEYPALARYLRYIIFKNEIDSEGFFKEIERLEEKIIQSYTRRQSARKIFNLVRDCLMLEKALNLNLDRQEAVAFRNRLEEFKTARFEKDCARKFSAPAVDQAVESVRDFYEKAERREKSFDIRFSRAEEDLQGKISSPQRHFAMIAGGFHREGIQAFLRYRSVPYAVITPAFSKDINQEFYQDILSGDYTKISVIPHARVSLMAGNLAARMMGAQALRHYGEAVMRFYEKINRGQGNKNGNGKQETHFARFSKKWTEDATLSPVRAEIRNVVNSRKDLGVKAILVSGLAAGLAAGFLLNGGTLSNNVEEVPIEPAAVVVPEIPVRAKNPVRPPDLRKPGWMGKIFHFEQPALQKDYEVRGNSVPRMPGDFEVHEKGDQKFLGETELTARIGGKIRWQVAPGSEVEEGAVIARIENPEWEASIRALQEEIAGLEKTLQNQINVTEKIKSGKEIQAKQTALENLKRQREELGVLRAPFPLHFLKSFIHEGAVVDAGTRLMEYVPLNRIWMRFSLEQKDVPPSAAAFGKIKIKTGPAGAALKTAEILQRRVSLDAETGNIVLDLELQTAEKLKDWGNPVSYHLTLEPYQTEGWEISREKTIWRTYGRIGMRVINEEVRTPSVLGTVRFESQEGENVAAGQVVGRIQSSEFYNDLLARQRNYINFLKRTLERFPKATNPSGYSTIEQIIKEQEELLLTYEAEARETEIKAPVSGVLQKTYRSRKNGLKPGSGVAQIATPEVLSAGPSKDGQWESQILIPRDLILNLPADKAPKDRFQAAKGDWVVVRTADGKILKGQIEDFVEHLQTPEDTLLSRYAAVTVKIEDPFFWLYPPSPGSAKGMPVEVIFPQPEEWPRLLLAIEKNQKDAPAPVPGFFSAGDRPLLVEWGLLQGGMKNRNAKLIEILLNEQNSFQRIKTLQYFIANYWDRTSMDLIGPLIFGEHQDLAEEIVQVLRDGVQTNPSRIQDLIHFLDQSLQHQKKARENRDEVGERIARNRTTMLYRALSEFLEQPQTPQGKIVMNYLADQYQQGNPAVVWFVLSVLKTESLDSLSTVALLEGPVFDNDDTLRVLGAGLRTAGENDTAFVLEREYLRRRMLHKVQTAELGFIPGIAKWLTANIRISTFELPFFFYEENKTADQNLLHFSDAPDYTLYADPSFRVVPETQAGVAPNITRLPDRFFLSDAVENTLTYFEKLSEKGKIAFIEQRAAQNNFEELSKLLTVPKFSLAFPRILESLLAGQEGRLYVARVFYRSENPQVLKQIEESGWRLLFLSDAAQAGFGAFEIQEGQTFLENHSVLPRAQKTVYRNTLMKLYKRTPAPDTQKRILKVYLTLVPSEFEVAAILRGDVPDNRWDELKAAVPQRTLARAVNSESQRRAILAMLRHEKKYFSWKSLGEFFPGTELETYQRLRQELDVRSFAIAAEGPLETKLPLELLEDLRVQADPSSRRMLERIIIEAEKRVSDVKQGFRVRIPLWEYAQKAMGYLFGFFIFFYAAVRLWSQFRVFKSRIRFRLDRSFRNQEMLGREFQADLEDLVRDVKSPKNERAFEGTNILTYFENWITILKKEEISEDDLSQMLHIAAAVAITRKIVYGTAWLRSMALLDIEGIGGLVYQFYVRLLTLTMRRIYTAAVRRQSTMDTEKKEQWYYFLKLFGRYARYGLGVRSSLVPISNIKETIGYQFLPTTSANLFFRYSMELIRSIYWVLQVFFGYTRTWLKGRHQHLDIVEQEVIPLGNALHPGLYENPEAILLEADDFIRGNFTGAVTEDMELGFKPWKRFRQFMSRFLMFLPFSTLAVGLVLSVYFYFVKGYVDINYLAIIASFVTGGAILGWAIHIFSVLMGWQDSFGERSIAMIRDYEAFFSRDVLQAEEPVDYVPFFKWKINNPFVVETARFTENFLNMVIFLLPNFPENLPWLRIVGLDRMYNRFILKASLHALYRNKIRWVKSPPVDLRRDSIATRFQRHQEALRRELTRGVPSTDVIVIVLPYERKNPKLIRYLSRHLKDVIRPDVPVFYVYPNYAGSGGAFLSAKMRINEIFSSEKYQLLQRKFLHLRDRKPSELRIGIVPAGGRGGIIPTLQGNDLLIPIPFEDRHGDYWDTGDLVLSNIYDLTQEMETAGRFGEVMASTDTLFIGLIGLQDGITLLASRRGMREVVEQRHGIVFGLYSDRGDISKFIEKADERELRDLVQKNPDAVDEINLENSSLAQFPIFAGFMASSFSSSEDYEDYNRKILMIQEKIEELSHGKEFIADIDITRDILIPLIRIATREEVSHYLKARIRATKNPEVREFYQKLFEWYDNSSADLFIPLSVDTPHDAFHYYRDVRSFDQWSRAMRDPLFVSEGGKKPLLIESIIENPEQAASSSIVLQVHGRLPASMPEDTFLTQIPMKLIFKKQPYERWVTFFSRRVSDFERNKIFGMDLEEFGRDFFDVNGQRLLTGYTDVRKIPLFPVTAEDKVEAGFLHFAALRLEGKPVRVGVSREDFFKGRISYDTLLKEIKHGALDYDRIGPAANRRGPAVVPVPGNGAAGNNGTGAPAPDTSARHEIRRVSPGVEAVPVPEDEKAVWTALLVTAGILNFKTAGPELLNRTAWMRESSFYRTRKLLAAAQGNFSAAVPLQERLRAVERLTAKTFSQDRVLFADSRLFNPELLARISKLYPKIVLWFKPKQMKRYQRYRHWIEKNHQGNIFYALPPGKDVAAVLRNLDSGERKLLPPDLRQFLTAEVSPRFVVLSSSETALEKIPELDTVSRFYWKAAGETDSTLTDMMLLLAAQKSPLFEEPSRVIALRPALPSVLTAIAEKEAGSGAALYSEEEPSAAGEGLLLENPNRRSEVRSAVALASAFKVKSGGKEWKISVENSEEGWIDRLIFETAFNKRPRLNLKSWLELWQPKNNRIKATARWRRKPVWEMVEGRRVSRVYEREYELEIMTPSGPKKFYLFSSGDKVVFFDPEAQGRLKAAFDHATKDGQPVPYGKLFFRHSANDILLREPEHPVRYRLEPDSRLAEGKEIYTVIPHNETKGVRVEIQPAGPASSSGERKHTYQFQWENKDYEMKVSAYLRPVAGKKPAGTTVSKKSSDKNAPPKPSNEPPPVTAGASTVKPAESPEIVFAEFKEPVTAETGEVASSAPPEIVFSEVKTGVRENGKGTRKKKRSEPVRILTPPVSLEAETEITGPAAGGAPQNNGRALPQPRLQQDNPRAKSWLLAFGAVILGFALTQEPAQKFFRNIWNFFSRPAVQKNEPLLKDKKEPAPAKDAVKPLEKPVVPPPAVEKEEVKEKKEAAAPVPVIPVAAVVPAPPAPAPVEIKPDPVVMIPAPPPVQAAIAEKLKSDRSKIDDLRGALMEIPFEAALQQEIQKRLRGADVFEKPDALVEKFLQEQLVRLEWNYNRRTAERDETKKEIIRLEAKIKEEPDEEGRKELLVEKRRADEKLAETEKMITELSRRLLNARRHYEARLERAAGKDEKKPEKTEAAAPSPAELLVRKTKSQDGMYRLQLEHLKRFRPGSPEGEAAKFYLALLDHLSKDEAYQEKRSAALVKFAGDFLERVRRGVSREEEFPFEYFVWMRAAESRSVEGAGILNEDQRKKLTAFIEEDIRRDRTQQAWDRFWKQWAAEVSKNAEKFEGQQAWTGQRVVFLNRRIEEARALDPKDPWIAEALEMLARLQKNKRTFETGKKFEEKSKALHRALNAEEFFTLRLEVAEEMLKAAQEFLASLDPANPVRGIWEREVEDLTRSRDGLKETVAKRADHKAADLEAAAAEAKVEESFREKEKILERIFKEGKISAKQKDFEMSLALKEKSWSLHRIHYEKKKNDAEKAKDEKGTAQWSSKLEVAEMQLRWVDAQRLLAGEFFDLKRHPENDAAGLDRLLKEAEKALDEARNAGGKKGPEVIHALDAKREAVRLRVRELELRWRLLMAGHERRIHEELLDAVIAGRVLPEDARRAAVLPVPEPELPDFEVTAEETEAFRSAKLFNDAEKADLPVVELTLDWHRNELLIMQGIMRKLGYQTNPKDPDGHAASLEPTVRDFAVYFAKTMRERRIEDQPEKRIIYLQAYYDGLSEVLRMLNGRDFRQMLPDEWRLPVEFRKTAENRFAFSHIDFLNKDWQHKNKNKSSGTYQNRFSLPSILGLVEAKISAFEAGSAEFRLSQLRLKAFQQYMSHDPQTQSAPPLVTLLWLMRKAELNAQFAEWLRWQSPQFINSAAGRQIIDNWVTNTIRQIDLRYQNAVSTFKQTNDYTMLNQFAFDMGYGNLELFILYLNHQVDMLHVQDPLLNVEFTDYALNGATTFGAEWYVLKYLNREFPYSHQNFDFRILKWYMVHTILQEPDLQALAAKEAATLGFKLVEFTKEMELLFTVDLDKQNLSKVEKTYGFENGKAMLKELKITADTSQDPPTVGRGFELLMKRLEEKSKGKNIGNSIPVIVRQGIQSIMRNLDHDIDNDKVIQGAIERLTTELKEAIPEFANEEVRREIAMRVVEQMVYRGRDFADEKVRLEMVRKIKEIYESGGFDAIKLLLRPEFEGFFEGDIFKDLITDQYKTWDLKKWQAFRARLKMVTNSLPDIENVRLRVLLNLLDEIDPPFLDGMTRDQIRQQHLERILRDFVALKNGMMDLPDIADAEAYLEEHYFQKEIINGVWTGGWYLRTDWEVNTALDRRGIQLSLLLAKEARSVMLRFLFSEVFYSLDRGDDEKRSVSDGRPLEARGGKMTLEEMIRLEADLWDQFKPLIESVNWVTGNASPNRRNPSRLFIRQTRDFLHDTALNIESKQISREGWAKALEVASHPQFQRQTLEFYHLLQGEKKTVKARPGDFFQFLMAESVKLIADGEESYGKERKMLVEFLRKESATPFEKRFLPKVMRDVRDTLKAVDRGLGIQNLSPRSLRLMEQLERTMIRSILIRHLNGEAREIPLNRLKTIRKLSENPVLLKQALEAAGPFWSAILGPEDSPAVFSTAMLKHSDSIMLLYVNFLTMAFEDGVDPDHKEQVETAAQLWIHNAKVWAEFLEKKPAKREVFLRALYERLRIRMGKFPEAGKDLTEPFSIDIKRLERQLAYFQYLQEAAFLVKEQVTVLKEKLDAPEDPAAAALAPGFWDAVRLSLTPKERERFDMAREIASKPSTRKRDLWKVTPSLPEEDRRLLNTDSLFIYAGEQNAVMSVPAYDPQNRMPLESFYAFRKDRWDKIKIVPSALLSGWAGKDRMALAEKAQLLQRLPPVPSGFQWYQGEKKTWSTLLTFKAADASLVLRDGTKIYLAMSGENPVPAWANAVHLKMEEDPVTKVSTMLLYVSFAGDDFTGFSLIKGISQGEKLSLEFWTESYPAFTAKKNPVHKFPAVQFGVGLNRADRLSYVKPEAGRVLEADLSRSQLLSFEANQTPAYRLQTAAGNYKLELPEVPGQKQVGRLSVFQAVREDVKTTQRLLTAGAEATGKAGENYYYHASLLSSPDPKDTDLKVPAAPAVGKKEPDIERAAAENKTAARLQQQYWNQSLFAAQAFYENLIGPEYFPSKPGEEGFTLPNLNFFRYDERGDAEKVNRDRQAQMEALAKNIPAQRMYRQFLELAARETGEVDGAELAENWKIFAARTAELKTLSKRENYRDLFLVLAWSRFQGKAGASLLEGASADAPDLLTLAAKIRDKKPWNWQDVLRPDKREEFLKEFSKMKSELGKGKRKDLEVFFLDEAMDFLRLKEDWLKNKLTAMTKRAELRTKDSIEEIEAFYMTQAGKEPISSEDIVMSSQAWTTLTFHTQSLAIIDKNIGDLNSEEAAAGFKFDEYIEEVYLRNIEPIFNSIKDPEERRRTAGRLLRESSVRLRKARQRLELKKNPLVDGSGMRALIKIENLLLTYRNAGEIGSLNGDFNGFYRFHRNALKAAEKRINELHDDEIKTFDLDDFLDQVYVGNIQDFLEPIEPQRRGILAGAMLADLRDLRHIQEKWVEKRAEIRRKDDLKISEQEKRHAAVEEFLDRIGLSPAEKTLYPVQNIFGISIVPVREIRKSDLELIDEILKRFPYKLLLLMVSNIGKGAEELNRFSRENYEGRVVVIPMRQDYLKTVDAFYRGDRRTIPMLREILLTANRLAEKAGTGSRMKINDLIRFTSVVFPQMTQPEFAELLYPGMLKTKLWVEPQPDESIREDRSDEAYKRRMLVSVILSLATAGVSNLDPVHLQPELLRNLKNITHNMAENSYSAWIAPEDNLETMLTSILVQYDTVFSAA